MDFQVTRTPAAHTPGPSCTCALDEQMIHNLLPGDPGLRFPDPSINTHICVHTHAFLKNLLLEARGDHLGRERKCGQPCSLLEMRRWPLCPPGSQLLHAVPIKDRASWGKGAAASLPGGERPESLLPGHIGRIGERGGIKRWKHEIN